MYYKLVKIVCIALVPAKRLSVRSITCQQINWAGVSRLSRRPANEPITVYKMVLAAKGLEKLPWTVIRSFVGCADKSS